MAPGSTATRLLVARSSDERSREDGVTAVMSGNPSDRESNSDQVSLGIVGPGIAVAQPRPHAGDPPHSGNCDHANEDPLVAGELRQEEQRDSDCEEDNKSGDV